MHTFLTITQRQTSAEITTTPHTHSRMYTHLQRQWRDAPTTATSYTRLLRMLPQQYSSSPTAALLSAVLEARRLVVVPLLLRLLLRLLLLPREAASAGPVNAWVDVRPKHARATAAEAAGFVLMMPCVALYLSSTTLCVQQQHNAFRRLGL